MSAGSRRRISTPRGGSGCRSACSRRRRWGAVPLPERERVARAEPEPGEGPDLGTPTLTRSRCALATSPALRAGEGEALRSCRSCRRVACLDRVPDARGEVDPVEAVDLLDARRRGDVDLGEVLADHVDADEDEAL